MAGPITWRTIYGQTPDAAARLMQTAQTSFNNGFDALGNVLQKEQDTSQQNWDNTKQNNTNEYLDKLAQYDTLEEMEAAQSSGAIDQLRAQYGKQIDSAAVRDADATRIDTLRERAMAGNAYTDQVQERLERPLVNQALGMAAEGNFEGLTAFIKANPNIQGLKGLVDEAGKLRVELFDNKMQQGQLDVSRGQLGVSQGQLGIAQSRNAREALSFQEERTDTMKLRALDAYAAKRLAETGNLSEARLDAAQYAKENGIPLSALNTTVSTLTKTHAANTEITPEQADAIAADPLLTVATTQAREAEEIAAKLPKYNPDITAADAMENVYKRVPAEQKDAKAKVNAAVATFINKRDFKGDIGPVLDLALRSSPTDENVWGEDMYLVSVGLAARLSEAYDQITAKQAADSAAVKAKNHAATVQAKLERNARNNNRPRSQ